jgi:hypothetical protein
MCENAVDSKTSKFAASTTSGTKVSPVVSQSYKYRLHHSSTLSSLLPSSRMNTSNMRAVLIKNGKGPVENLYIGETAVPTLQPGEVLVKARQASYREMPGLRVLI